MSKLKNGQKVENVRAGIAVSLDSFNKILSMMRKQQKERIKCYYPVNIRPPTYFKSENNVKT